EPAKPKELMEPPVSCAYGWNASLHACNPAPQPPPDNVCRSESPPPTCVSKTTQELRGQPNSDVHYPAAPGEQAGGGNGSSKIDGGRFLDNLHRFILRSQTLLPSAPSGVK